MLVVEVKEQCAWSIGEKVAFFYVHVNCPDRIGQILELPEVEARALAAAFPGTTPGVPALEFDIRPSSILAISGIEYEAIPCNRGVFFYHIHCTGTGPIKRSSDECTSENRDQTLRALAAERAAVRTIFHNHIQQEAAVVASRGGE